jgi:hypothetical protein
MLCTKCTKEASSGKVKKGVFICDPCLKAEKDSKSILITRYAKAQWIPNFKIVSATYKESPANWMLVEYDKDWPNKDQKRSKKCSLPGYASAQEAVSGNYKNKLSRLISAKKQVDECREDLAEFIEYAKAHGYDLPKEETP